MKRAQLGELQTRAETVRQKLADQIGRGRTRGWHLYVARRTARLARLNRLEAVAVARLGDGSGIGRTAAGDLRQLIELNEENTHE